VTFPPNQDVNIQVSYLLEGTGEYPFVAFYYLLHTGAGWNGTIGSADLIVRLPYEATTQNVIFDESTGWSQTTPGGAIQGQDVRWHFEDLEPDQSNDFQISLVMPSAWQQVLRERGNVSANPNDGEAWGRLGKLYKEMFFFRKGFRTDAGGQQLYALSMDAYEKCLSLLPNDALWHAGFADLLAYHAWFSAYDAQDVRPEMLHAMQEINTALQIAPDNKKVKEIADTIYYSFPADSVRQLESGYDFLWLTTTPDLSTPTLVPVEVTFTPPAAPTATNLPAITETTVPEKEATPVPTSTPVNAKNPLCGAGFLIPLGLVWLARHRAFLRS
jgi:hypothetical protein